MPAERSGSRTPSAALYALAGLALISALLAAPLEAAPRAAIVSDPLTVLYPEPAASAAREVVALYPELASELTETFGWSGGLRRPLKVVLLGGEEFSEFTGASRVIALASAEEGLVVMDLSRAPVDPEGLRGILKHELAHIYLGRNITLRKMPRWLDEGIAQWVSGGAAELLSVGRTTELARAVLIGRLIRLGDLSRGFPSDSRGMRLAYQESRSMVEFIVGRYGQAGLMRVLEGLKQGQTLDAAIMRGLSVSTAELERAWVGHLKRRHTALAYLSNNIYTVLFVLAALLTLLGFIRMMLRYRAYGEDEEEDDDYGDPYHGGRDRRGPDHRGLN